VVAYNILEARDNLSRIIASVESGVEATIMRRGKPVARIVPIDDDLPAPGSGAALAAWFAAHPVGEESRSPGEIEAGLAEMREAGA